MTTITDSDFESTVTSQKRSFGIQRDIMNFIKSTKCKKTFTVTYIYEHLGGTWTLPQVRRAMHGLYRNSTLSRTGVRGNTLFSLPVSLTVTETETDEKDPLELLLEAMKIAEPRIRQLLKIEKTLQSLLPESSHSLSQQRT